MKSPADSPEQRVVSQIRTRAILFLVAAVAAGSGAVVLVKQYLEGLRHAAAVAAPKTKPVVVAAMDIPIAVRLEAKHVAIINWPDQSVPEGAFSDVKDVIDKTARSNIVKGEAILGERLADEDQGQGLAALLADGMRAMAVEVDAVVGVAGFVQPGDYVDVITTMSPDEETHKQRKDEAAKVSKIVLQYVRVLAVGEQLGTTPGGKPINVKVVTLGVTPQESEKLALASQYGKLQLALRSRIDQISATTNGVTPAKLLSANDLDEPKLETKQTFRNPRPRPKIPEPEPPPVEKKPEAPVVEILRGNRVEERRLRPSPQAAQP